MVDQKNIPAIIFAQNALSAANATDSLAARGLRSIRSKELELSEGFDDQLQDSLLAKRRKLLNSIHVGLDVEGTIKKIIEHGAFVDLGGVDALMHISDITWQPINHPSEIFSIGQRIKARVTNYDALMERVSVSMKDLEPSPWDNILQKYYVGMKLRGKITNITDYGAFAKLDSGIEGLIHSSEMSWKKKIPHPSKLVQPDQEVIVQVLDIDADKHRISLGMRQCIDNPWPKFYGHYYKGDILQGVVIAQGLITNMMERGAIISLEEDVEGILLYLDGQKDLFIGQKINVVISDIDQVRQGISLTMHEGATHAS